jgi:hypothetical protein
MSKYTYIHTQTNTHTHSDVAQALTDKKHGQHKYINVNGLRLHYVEKGEPSPKSPLVIFLHGFPEFWYSW